MNNLCETCDRSYATWKNYGVIYACGFNFCFNEYKYIPKQECDKYNKATEEEIKDKKEEFAYYVNMARIKNLPTVQDKEVAPVSCGKPSLEPVGIINREIK